MVLVCIRSGRSSIFNISDPKRHLPYWACARALSVRAVLSDVSIQPGNYLLCTMPSLILGPGGTSVLPNVF